MNDLFLRGTIRQLLEAYRRKQVSPVEICEALLARIESHDPQIGAFLSFDRSAVLARARETEANLDKPLAGIPIAIKDNICMAGMRTTCGSRMLQNYVSPYDATVVTRLKEAGAIIIGKTNCDEFAMGSSTENSGYQVTRNPWARDRSPGGSSGGSAAAVASCFALAALGSDTGGSVRQPASLCGVVGLKPTYGRVSRYGLVAFGSSLDCIGTLTRSAEDSALLLSVIAGFDPKDSTSARQPVPDSFNQMRKRPLKIGIPEEYFGEGIDIEVASAVQTAIASLEKSDRIEITKISLPHSRYAIAAYYVIATAEASSNLSRFDGVRYGLRAGKDLPLNAMYSRTRAEGFGDEVKRRIMLGTFALSSGYYDAYYLQASRVRNLIARDFQNAFANVDLICTPTSPTAAFKLGEKLDDPLAMYLSDIYTVTLNLAGLPAISVPCGFTSSKLPVGLQIIGNYFQEESILQLALDYLQDHPIQLPEIS